MPEVIDRAFLERVVPEILGEFGHDYVYPGSEHGDCKYVRDGKPSCLVGHVFFRAGVPLEDLEWLDVRPIGSCSDPACDCDGTEGTNAGEAPKYLKQRGIELEFNSGIGAALDSVQRAQDAGMTWGDSWGTAVQCMDRL